MGPKGTDIAVTGAAVGMKGYERPARQMVYDENYDDDEDEEMEDVERVMGGADEVEDLVEDWTGFLLWREIRARYTRVMVTRSPWRSLMLIFKLAILRGIEEELE